MSNAFYRQFQVLRHIPRTPRSITVQELASKLRGEGIETTVRTIQRDLNELSEKFPITSDAEGRTQRWFSVGSKTFDIPGMGPGEALVFRMAELHLSSVLPASQLGQMRPYFDQARTVIESSGIPLSRWRKRVRVINRGPKLGLPTIGAGIADAIHEGLLMGRRVAITYRKRGDQELKEYEASIHALVAKDGIIYAVASLWDFADILHLALHRVIKAAALDKPANHPKNFDLDHYIETQAVFSYPVASASEINLQMVVSTDVRNHLAERPLSKNQSLSELGEDRWQVNATVVPSQELKWWVLGLGDAVEVIKPAPFREDIAETVGRMHKRYS